MISNVNKNTWYAETATTGFNFRNIRDRKDNTDKRPIYQQQGVLASINSDKQQANLIFANTCVWDLDHMAINMTGYHQRTNNCGLSG